MNAVDWVSSKTSNNQEIELTQIKLGGTPLHDAALFGHLEVCKCLKEHGAELNAQNDVSE